MVAADVRRRTRGGLHSIRLLTSAATRGLSGLALPKLLFQRAHPAQKFWQMLKGDQLAFRLGIWLGRCAEPFLSVRNVSHDAGLRRDGDPASDL